jgi:hypothetical protein
LITFLTDKAHKTCVKKRLKAAINSMPRVEEKILEAPDDGP